MSIVPFQWSKGNYLIWGYVQNNRYVILGVVYREESDAVDIETVLAELRELNQRKGKQRE